MWVVHRVFYRQHLQKLTQTFQIDSICESKLGRSAYTHGADALHGEQYDGEELRQASNRSDEWSRFYGRQRLGGLRYGGVRAGDQFTITERKKAHTPHDEEHGAPDTDQYETGGQSRKRYQYPESTRHTQRHERHQQQHNPSLLR